MFEKITLAVFTINVSTFLTLTSPRNQIRDQNSHCNVKIVILAVPSLFDF